MRKLFILPTIALCMGLSMANVQADQLTFGPYGLPYDPITAKGQGQQADELTFNPYGLPYDPITVKGQGQQADQLTFNPYGLPVPPYEDCSATLAGYPSIRNVRDISRQQACSNPSAKMVTPAIIMPLVNPIRPKRLRD